MAPRITFVTLGVTDLSRARAFYEALGFPLRGCKGEEVAFFEAGGVVLALWRRASLAAEIGIEPGKGFAAAALSLNVDSHAAVAATCDLWVAAGGSLLRPARDTSWGGHAAWLADPDGHIWEVVWNPRRPVGTDGAAPPA